MCQVLRSDREQKNHCHGTRSSLDLTLIEVAVELSKWLSLVQPTSSPRQETKKTLHRMFAWTLGFDMCAALNECSCANCSFQRVCTGALKWRSVLKTFQSCRIGERGEWIPCVRATNTRAGYAAFRMWFLVSGILAQILQTFFSCPEGKSFKCFPARLAFWSTVKVLLRCNSNSLPMNVITRQRWSWARQRWAVKLILCNVGTKWSVARRDICKKN